MHCSSSCTYTLYGKHHGMSIGFIDHGGCPLFGVIFCSKWIIIEIRLNCIQSDAGTRNHF